MAFAYTWYVGGSSSSDQNGGSSYANNGAYIEQKTDLIAGSLGGGNYYFASATAWGSGLVGQVIRWDYAGDDALLRVEAVEDEELFGYLLSGSVTTGVGGKTGTVGGAFASPGEACLAIKSNFSNRICIKTGTYTDEQGTSDSIVDIVATGSATSPIAVEAYGTTPGDLDGQTFETDDKYAILDAQDALTYCIRRSGAGAYCYWTFKHIICQNAIANNAAGVALGNAWLTNMVDCGSRNHDANAGDGFRIGFYGVLTGCWAFNDGRRGFDMTTSNTSLYNCRAKGNAVYDVYSEGYEVTVSGCWIYTTGTAAIGFFNANSVVDGCTIVGGGSKAYHGIKVNGAQATVRNTAFFNLDAVLNDASTYADSCTFNNCMYGKYNSLTTTGRTPMAWDNIDAGGGADADDMGFMQTGSASDPAYYQLRGDSPALAAGTPAYRSIGWDQPEAVSQIEIHLCKAILCNKRTQDIATGVVTVYDDDGTTPILTLTPSESGGVITITPAEPNSGIPATASTEMHLIKATLANKRTHTIETAVDVVKDDDGSTTVLTLMPTESNGVVTVTPS